MKHINSPKRPTLQQKKFIAKHHLIPKHWLIIEDNSNYILVKNKRTGKVRAIVKEGEMFHDSNTNYKS